MGLIERGLLKPTVFDKKYKGLESVREVLKDLHERRVWGKAVVRICEQEGKVMKEDKPRL